MTSVFSRIIAGELPGHLVHEDHECVVLLDVAPVHEGHCLVIPRVEIDQWTDVPEDLVVHLMAVAHRIARAQERAFDAARIGLLIAGFEVPHTHLHVLPVDDMRGFDLSARKGSTDPAHLTAVAARLRIALADLDH